MKKSNIFLIALAALVVWTAMTFWFGIKYGTETVSPVDRSILKDSVRVLNDSNKILRYDIQKEREKRVLLEASATANEKIMDSITAEIIILIREQDDEANYNYRTAGFDELDSIWAGLRVPRTAGN